MEYDLFIDKQINVLFERFRGKVTADDFREAIKESYRHPDWEKGQDVLCDIREAEFDMNYEKMSSAIRSFSPDDRSNKLALVVKRDLEYGMFRMFQALTEPTEIWREMKIFRDINEAKEWLGVPDSTQFPEDAKWLMR